MKHPAVRLLLCVCIVLSILQPALGVSRLFVDELTGYTTELVTADDVRTDLMIVNNQTVDGSVTADSPNSHTVNTPGSISVNAANTNIEIAQNINIESFGENVKFTGENVLLGAGTGDFINTAIHQSIVASEEVQLLGGNFEVDGVHVKVRTPGEIFFSSDLNFNVNVEDKVEFLASHVTFEAESTTINSELSNVHFKAGDEYSITGSSLSVYGESGARILAQQGDLSIVSSESSASLLAENIQLDGISQSALIAEDGYIGAISLNFNIESDRTIAGAEGAVYIEVLDDLTAVSFGVIKSIASSVSIDSLVLSYTPEDQLRFVAATDILVDGGDLTWNADAANFKAHRDALLGAQSIEFDLAGGAVLKSVDGDYTIDSSVLIEVESFNSNINAIEQFSLASSNIEVVADNYIEFLAEGDINISTTTFSINTGEFEVFARESAQLSSQTDATFSSTVNPLGVESSAFIVVEAPTGQYSNSADSIQYTALNLLLLNSNDDIYFNTAVNTLLQTRGNFRFEALRDLDVNADSVTISALNSNVESGELFLDAFSVTFSTSSIGEFSLTSKASSSIVLSAAGDGGSVHYQAVGNIEFYSQHQIAFEFSEFFDIIANDVVVSSENGLTSIGDGSLLFAAPTIYGLIKSSFGANDAISFVGATSFTAPTSRTNSVSLNSPSQIFDFFTAVISGGEVDLGGEVVSFGSDTDIIFESGNEQDIVFFSSSDTELITSYLENSFTESLNYNANSVDISTGSYLSHTDGPTSFYAYGTLSISSPNGQSMSAYEDLVFEGDFGVTVNIAGDLTANFVDNLSFKAYNNDINSDFTLAITITNDLNIAMDTTLESTGSDLEINSDTDIHSLYSSINMNLQSNMVIEALEGFTIAATNRATLVSDGDINVNSPSGVYAKGGDILVTGESSVLISNLGDVTIGSNPPSISSPNYHSVIFTVSNDLNGESDGFLGIYASGNEEYHDEAISIDTLNMTLTSAGDFDVTGNNGINVMTELFSAEALTVINIVAQNGGIKAVTHGPANSLTIESSTAGEVSGSIAFVSNDAGLSQIAFDEVSFHGFNDITSSILENSRIKTLYDESPVDIQSQTGIIEMTVGGDYTISNGDARNLAGSLSIDALSELSITSLDDIRFHSLARGDTVTPSISFVASNTLVPLNENGQYIVDVANAINYYPSGDVTVFAASDATFTASGPYSFGTTQGDASFISTDLSYTASGDYNMTAGGVNGEIDSTYGASTYTAAANYNVKSNSSTTINSDELNMNADRHIRFTTFSEESGVYGSAMNAVFQSESTSLITGVNVTGNAVTFSSESSTTVHTTHFTIGQNNAQFNPQINGHVNSWEVNSDGTNQIQSKDNILLHSSSFSSNAGTNTIITAGGAMEFATTWNSLLPGDGVLSIRSNSGQITANANAGYIDYHVKGQGSIHSQGQLQIQSSGTSTSSPSTSGIIFQGTNGEIAFNSASTFSEEITTTAAIDAGDDGVFVEAGSSIALSASTGSSRLRSDQSIDSFSRFNTALATTGNNARMAITTTGDLAPLSLKGDHIKVASIVDGVELNGKEVFQFTRNSTVIRTGENNNGQVVFKSSGDLVIHSNVDTSFSTQGDFYIDAAGSASDFTIDTAQTMSIHSSLDSTFSTTPGEGGSIRFLLDDNEELSMTGNTWTIDSDLDLNVATNGSFIIHSGGKFDTSVTGYIDISSEKSIAFRSTDDAGADVVFHADKADVIFGSVQSTDFVAGANGYGNATFVISGDASFTANGNFSSTSTSSLLIESLIGDSMFNSMRGNLDVQAYEHLSLLAFGSVTDTGYIKFQSRSPASNDNGIVIESTHNGGDIFLSGIGAAFVAQDISFHATGTSTTTGYINIVNDWDLGKGDLGTLGDNTDDLLEVEDFPAVKFDSGTQTLIRSETGDIHVNYGRRLLLRGGSVAAIASGGIQFNNRGENRQISVDIGDNSFFFDQPSSFDITQFNVLTFRTNNLGQGEIRVVAESSIVRAKTGITLIRNNADQLMIQGSSATVFRCRPDNQFPGITFNSFDYLSVSAFDDDIVQWGRVIRYGVLNGNGALTFESHANSDGLAHFHSADGTTTFNNPNEFAAKLDGDFNLITTTEIHHVIEDDYDVYSAKNILLSYADSIDINGDDYLEFRTYQYDYWWWWWWEQPSANQKIQFAGSTVNDLESYSPTALDEMTAKVTISSDLYYYPPGIQSFTRGAACLYERSIVFGFSQGVGNICICLDQVWLCGDATNNGEPVYDFYKLPYQGPYFGTGPK